MEVVDTIEVVARREAVRTIKEVKIATIHSKKTHAYFMSIVSWPWVMQGSNR